jgi:hypothetical protein
LPLSVQARSKIAVGKLDFAGTGRTIPTSIHEAMLNIAARRIFYVLRRSSLHFGIRKMLFLLADSQAPH